jgi:hypothetical protein
MPLKCILDQRVVVPIGVQTPRRLPRTYYLVAIQPDDD